MNKRYLFYALILFTCCGPLTLQAYHSPSDSIQARSYGSFRSKIFNQKIQVNIGFDAEPTRNTRINGIGIIPIVNLGISYDFNLNKRWTVRPEFWYQQFATPRLTLIKSEKSDPDGLRVQTGDTLSLLRMAGYNFGISAKRTMGSGFSIFGGVQCGWYKKGLSESASSSVDMNGSRYGSESTSYSGYDKIPEWFNGVQPGLKLGVEKAFLKRFVLGASLYQGLTDMTDFPEGGKNFSTNYLVYVGVKL
jgi:hypothetical protein